MKQLIKSFSFLILLVFIFPLCCFACDELKFEDVPYIESSMTANEIITNVNNARTYMISSLGLKVKTETVNTFEFFKTKDDSIQNKVIKDVIVSTIGTSKFDPVISQVEVTRYVNGNMLYKETKNYVKKTNSNEIVTTYCYTDFVDYSGDEVVYQKDRDKYDENTYTLLKLFNDVIVEAKVNEIDVVKEKEFEGIKYYQLEGKNDGIDVANKRFSNNETIQENPELFQVVKKGYDSAIPFKYEYALNASNYINYASISYDVINSSRELYLRVNSTTRVNSYGENVATLSQPEDVDDYTVPSFMNLMKSDISYISYKDSLESSYTLTTVKKVGVENPNYSICVEIYQNGAKAKENYYYLEFQSDEEGYKTYSIDMLNLTFSEYDEELDFKLKSFDFNNDFNLKNEEYYQYGSNQSYVNIALNNNEIYTISTSENSSDITLFIVDYGKNIQGVTLISDLSDLR